MGSTVDLALAQISAISLFSIICLLKFCLAVEILAPSDMEALFGSNSHVGHKTADLTTLIVAQAALEVQRSLVAMVNASFLTRYRKSLLHPYSKH